MAKKKGASRGAKKKSASRAARRKTVAKRPTRRPRTGLENPKQINLTPLKAQLRAHIERLERVKEPSLQVQQTLEILQRARQELSSPCGSTMVLDVTQ